MRAEPQAEHIRRLTARIDLGIQVVCHGRVIQADAGDRGRTGSKPILVIATKYNDHVGY